MAFYHSSFLDYSHLILKVAGDYLADFPAKRCLLPCSILCQLASAEYSNVTTTAPVAAGRLCTISRTKKYHDRAPWNSSVLSSLPDGFASVFPLVSGLQMDLTLLQSITRSR